MRNQMRNSHITGPQQIRQYRHGRYQTTSVLLLVVIAATFFAGMAGMPGIIA